MSYKIVRFYRDTKHPDHLKVVDTGLSLEEAQDHCNDPTTHEKGVWFDGFQEEDSVRRPGPGPLETLAQIAWMERNGRDW